MHQATLKRSWYLVGFQRGVGYEAGGRHHTTLSGKLLLVGLVRDKETTTWALLAPMER